MSLWPPAALATPTGQPGGWTVEAPAGAGVRARGWLDGDDGTLSLAVSRRGREVLAAAPAGLTTVEADLTRGLRPAGKLVSRVVPARHRRR